jgi:hydrogenase expression/formation protein HypE
VQIVTGDTKVVDHGCGDGVFINTAGIGILTDEINISPEQIQVGDSIIVNSDLARHGIAIMLSREDMEFENKIESDCADLSGLVQALIEAGVTLHCLRDLTRGGLASALIELATSSSHAFEIDEATLPIHSDVNSACEILGFDPLYIANEGCFVMFVPESAILQALTILQRNSLGEQSVVVGKVIAKHDKGLVNLKTGMGVYRVVDLLSGEQLPRIC